MNGTKDTQGWAMHEHYYENIGGGLVFDGCSITAEPSGAKVANVEHLGDAFLIAAAPELLAAGEAIAAFFDEYDDLASWSTLVDDMRAAIAKARGEGAETSE